MYVLFAKDGSGYIKTIGYKEKSTEWFWEYTSDLQEAQLFHENQVFYRILFNNGSLNCDDFEMLTAREEIRVTTVLV